VWLPDMTSYLYLLEVVSFSESTGMACLKETWPCLYIPYHSRMTWKMQEVHQNKFKVASLELSDFLFMCMYWFMSIHYMRKKLLAMHNKLTETLDHSLYKISLMLIPQGDVHSLICMLIKHNFLLSTDQTGRTNFHSCTCIYYCIV